MLGSGLCSAGEVGGKGEAPSKRRLIQPDTDHSALPCEGALRVVPKSRARNMIHFAHVEAQVKGLILRFLELLSQFCGPIRIGPVRQLLLLDSQHGLHYFDF